MTNKGAWYSNESVLVGYKKRSVRVSEIDGELRNRQKTTRVELTASRRRTAEAFNRHACGAGAQARSRKEGRRAQQTRGQKATSPRVAG